MNFDECHRIIKKGDVVSLRHAIDSGNIDPNLRNQFSWTLLMLAALEGNTSIGELLLERGASVNALNSFGETAMSLAAHKGHVSFLRMVLEAGASPDVRPHGHSLEDWLTAATGLPPAKIDLILQIVDATRRERNSID